MKKTTRYYELDLLRFFAAMAVVMFHYLFRGPIDGYTPVSYAPFDAYAQYGFMGINLFFMISGFVILLSASNRDALGFAISRITRLYPAFWVGVTLTALVLLFFGGGVNEGSYGVTLPQYLTNLTMLAGFVGVTDIDGVYWTLYIELQFYALIFILLLFNKIKKIEIVFSVWILIQLLALFITLPSIVSFLIFPEWAPYFISGASFYLLKVKGVTKLRLVNLLFSFSLSLLMAADGITTLNSLYNNNAEPFVAVVIVSVFHLIFVLMVFDKLSWFRSHWAIKIGALTYPLYLIHQNIGYIAFNLLNGYLNKYVLLAVIVLSLLSLSWFIHMTVERRLAPLFRAKLTSITSKLIKTNPLV